MGLSPGFTCQTTDSVPLKLLFGFHWVRNAETLSALCRISYLSWVEVTRCSFWCLMDVRQENFGIKVLSCGILYDWKSYAKKKKISYDHSSWRLPHNPELWTLYIFPLTLKDYKHGDCEGSSWLAKLLGVNLSKLMSKQNLSTEAVCKGNRLLLLYNRRTSFAQGNMRTVCECSALALTFFLPSHCPGFLSSRVSHWGCVLHTGTIQTGNN